MPAKESATRAAEGNAGLPSMVVGGQREMMWAFESSGTRMPVERWGFYMRFAADVLQQDAFRQKLKAGNYREKRGVLDTDTSN